MNLHLLEKALKSDPSHSILKDMYGSRDIHMHEERYLEVARGFSETFKSQEFELFTSAGRTEILGNHTDHNHGRIAAGSVQLDCIAAAAPNHSNKIHIVSQTYQQDLLFDLGYLEPTHRKTGTIALVRGVLAGLVHQNYTVRGVDIYTTSIIPGGAGVSSSAAFEMLICTIIDYFFNAYQQDIISYAKAGQYAENVYWEKKSGLMDQIACAAGGIVTVDFKDSISPVVQKLDFLPQDLGLDLILVNTGRGHSDLSAEYSSIPDEMYAAASYFHKKTLREVSEEDFLSALPSIRNKCSDRAVLRSLHYFEENKRVDLLVEAACTKNKELFLQMIRASGNSSWKWLQNCYLGSSPDSQDLSLALALTELYLQDKNGACRVHGGGFAGTIAVYLPKEFSEDYIHYIERVLGKGKAYYIHLRRQGACRLAFPC